MKAISRWLDRFCYNHPNFGIPNLIKYIVIGNVLIYFLDMFSNGYVSWALGFYPGLIFQGQIWRLITFVFIPESSGFILWFVMTTLLSTTSEISWSGSGVRPVLLFFMAWVYY